MHGAVLSCSAYRCDSTQVGDQIFECIRNTFGLRASVLAKRFISVSTIVVGCEAHDRADAMVDRWLSLGGGTATSSTVYIEDRTCENTTVSAYLMSYLPR